MIRNEEKQGLIKPDNLADPHRILRNQRKQMNLNVATQGSDCEVTNLTLRICVKEVS